MGSDLLWLVQLLGVWIVSEWMGAGRPKRLQLVELGPGKGSLAGDILRVSLLLLCHTNDKNNGSLFALEDV